MDLTVKKQLQQAASAALQQAYAPYSGLRVGAAVLGADGQIFSGCNVENASYGLTICAERAAVFQAVAAGQQHICAVAVVSDSVQVNGICGACRQVLSEFGPQAEVVFKNPEGERETTLDRLLPDSFKLQDNTQG